MIHKEHNGRAVRKFTLLLTIMLFAVTPTLGEGLLPALVDVYGVAMPSIGETLGRYADSETAEADGNAEGEPSLQADIPENEPAPAEGSDAE